MKKLCVYLYKHDFFMEKCYLCTIYHKKMRYKGQKYIIYEIEQDSGGHAADGGRHGGGSVGSRLAG